MAGTLHELRGPGSVRSLPEKEKQEQRKKSGHRTRKEVLWQEFFRDPSRWWDKRSSKRGTNFPDFRHKTTQECLWIDSWSNPSWVSEELRIRGLSISTQAQHAGLPTQIGTALSPFPSSHVKQSRNRDSKPPPGAAAAAFIALLKTCVRSQDLHKGSRIHDDLLKQGLLENCSDALIVMYAKCGALTEALEVFNNLPARDVVSWNSLIAGYAKHGQAHQALRWVSKMQLEAISPDVVSWNSAILGFAEEGEHEKAKGLYALMQEQGILPDYVTLINILKACCNATGLETGKLVHAHVHSYGGLANEDRLTLTNALMDMYSHCGSMIDTQRLFDATGLRNAITWNALISGYTRQGEIDSALHYFEKMLDVGIKPCEITFLSILTACSHAGLGRDKAEKYFELMNSMYDITPSVYHHSCLVDRLVRAGQLSEAAILLENFSLKPDPVIWNTMLGACQMSGNAEFEKTVYESALRLRGK